MFHRFFSFLLQGPDTYLSFHFLSLLLCGLPGRQSPRFGSFWVFLGFFPFFFFFFLLSLGLVVWPRLSDLFVSQNLRNVCASHFPRWILGCALLLLYSLQIFHITFDRWFLAGWYYVHFRTNTFGKGMNPLYHSYVINTSPSILLQG